MPRLPILRSFRGRHHPEPQSKPLGLGSTWWNHHGRWREKATEVAHPWRLRVDTEREPLVFHLAYHGSPQLRDLRDAKIARHLLALFEMRGDKAGTAYRRSRKA